MLIAGLTILRACFRLLWIAGVTALLALAVMPHLLGVVDRQMYIVRGSSMTPDIPLGAVVVIHRIDARQVHVGDVITFRAGNSAVVTHRVTSVSGGSQLTFGTKGDASQSPDPVVVPAEAVIGRVELDVPTVGMVMTVLASTAGMVVVLGLFASLLLGGWFIDELVGTIVRFTSRKSLPETVT